MFRPAELEEDEPPCEVEGELETLLPDEVVDNEPELVPLVEFEVPTASALGIHLSCT